MTEIFDDETVEQSTIAAIGLHGESTRVFTLTQELAILDAYAKQLEEQTKFVKKLGEEVTQALLNHEDFMDISNAKMRVSPALIIEVLAKVNAHMESMGIMGGLVINHPITAYRKESWFASIPAGLMDEAIANITNEADPAWCGLVKSSINANSLRGRVNEVIKGITSSELLTPEAVKENLPEYLRDLVTVTRKYDVVTMKGSR
jgi:hypothetical protein